MNLKNQNIVCDIPLLWSEDMEYIVWLQQLMYGKIHGTFIYIYSSTIDIWEIHGMYK